LSRRLDLDLFNLVYPSIQSMLQAPALIPALIHPIKQIIKSFGKDPKAWLDEKFLMDTHEQSKQPKDDTGANVRPSITLQFNDLDGLMRDGQPRQLTQPQKEVLKNYFGIEVKEPLFVGGGQEADVMPPMAGEPEEMGGPPPPEMSTTSGIEAPQVADIGQAPTTLEGAVEGASRFG
jgi:hypothetical protein